MATPFNKYTLKDILIDPDDKAHEYDTNFIQNSHTNSKAQFKKYDLPTISEIIPSWLYLGNKVDASDKSLLQKSGITHILNVSHNLPCYFPKDFTYAQIKVDDRPSYNLGQYFDAATEFIDLVNPTRNKKNKDQHLRVFVHCAVGKSRSSSIVIQYLMRTGIDFENKALLKKIEEFGMIKQFISDDRIYKRSLNVSCCRCCFCWLRCCNGMESGQNEETKSDGDEKYEALQRECDIESMSYRNSCDFVQKCRSIVCPNESFATQLAKFEEFIRNNVSTFELCYTWKHHGITPKRCNYADVDDA